MMAPMLVHRCTACGEEYQLEAVLPACVECGGRLQTVDDEAVPYQPRSRATGQGDDDAGEAQRDRTPPEGYGVVHTTRDCRDLVGLAERLEAAGIPFRVIEQPGERGYAPTSYRVMVHEARGLEAKRAIAPLLGMDPADVVQEFDPEQGYGQCPACSGSIPSGADSCPECGLHVASDEEEGAG